jgi:hypothetical protein
MSYPHFPKPRVGAGVPVLAGIVVRFEPKMGLRSSSS